MYGNEWCAWSDVGVYNIFSKGIPANLISLLSTQNTVESFNLLMEGSVFECGRSDPDISKRTIISFLTFSNLGICLTVPHIFYFEKTHVNQPINQVFFFLFKS